MTNQDQARYVLTKKGMEYLAERAGVPPSVFAYSSGITFFDPEAGESPLDAVPHVEHTIGVADFFVRLARDVREAGGRLVHWLNEAESAQRFATLHGRDAWIRPDGAGTVSLGEQQFCFLLEYERGSLDGGDLRKKLVGYGRYYDSHAWGQRFSSKPVLFFVSASDSAERRVLRALNQSEPSATVLLTTDWRYRRWGVLGEVWRSVTQDRRCPLADAIP